MSNTLTIERHPVRITVLKKHFHQEFVEKYAANPAAWTECKHFEVGQEFEVRREEDEPGSDPSGFGFRHEWHSRRASHFRRNRNPKGLATGSDFSDQEVCAR